MQAYLTCLYGTSGFTNLGLDSDYACLCVKQLSSGIFPS